MATRGSGLHASARLIAMLDEADLDRLARPELWIRSGLWLSLNEGPLVTLSVESLGYAERQLLEWENRIAAMATVAASDRNLPNRA